MRIHFSTTDLPKKAAKRVLKHYQSGWPESPFKLSHAQELTAQMLGYDSWYNLVRVTQDGTHPQSAMDEECSECEQLERLKYQAEKLKDRTPRDISRMDLAIQFRVSARSASSGVLSENIHSTNRLTFCIRKPKHQSEWVFQPSLRSRSTFALIADSQAQTDQNINQALAFMTWMDQEIVERPEDIYLIEEYLRISIHFGFYDRVSHHLDKFAQELKAAIPKSFDNTTLGNL